MMNSSHLLRLLWIGMVVGVVASTTLAGGGSLHRAQDLVPITPQAEDGLEPSGVATGVPQIHDLVRIDLLRPESEEDVERTYLLGHRSEGGHVVFGHRRLHVGNVQAASDMTPIEFHIDPERGTYRARPLPSPRGQDLTPSFQAATTEIGANEGYYLRYYVETWEPARHFIPVAVLNRTHLEVEWSECQDSSGFYDIQLDGVWEDCWANPQTFVYTTWFNNLCQAYGGSPWAWVDAHYYNYDFGLDSLRTDVDLTLNAHIQGQGWVDAWFTFTPSGEAASFLTGVEGPADWGPSLDNCPESSSEPTCCSGGGGGDGGDGGGGGDGGSTDTCVPVYDGITDEYLGDCCGSTTSEIVECAEGFL